MVEVKEIESQGEIEGLRDLLNSEEAEELADGSDENEMSYDCD